MTTRALLARLSGVAALVVAGSAPTVNAADAATRPQPGQAPVEAPLSHATEGSGTGPRLAADTTVAASPERLRLTLADAIARGLEHNLAAVLADAGVRAAEGARLTALAGLLPHLSAALVGSRQKISLEQYGFPVAPGESPLIGSYDFVLGQVAVSQAVFDLAALERARAGGEYLAAARFSRQDARDLVVTTCAALYLQAVTDTSRVDVSRSQLATAEALERRARDLKEAGTVAGIEVLRAQVQLTAQRQRLIVAENGLARDTLALAKAIGAPLARPLELVDAVPFAELSNVSLEAALARARESRADLKSAEAMLRAAEDHLGAAHSHHLPSLHLDASVARVGPTWDTGKRIFSIAGMVRIPLFEGGSVQGQVTQARAQVDQQRARVAELVARIEYEVRTALLDLQAATEQVQVATAGHDLAARQLELSGDRFAAGVTSNIEVVQAQQALAEASEAMITSRQAHNLAKLALARATGVAEAAAGHVFGGGT